MSFYSSRLIVSHRVTGVKYNKTLKTYAKVNNHCTNYSINTKKNVTNCKKGQYQCLTSLFNFHVHSPFQVFASSSRLIASHRVTTENSTKHLQTFDPYRKSLLNKQFTKKITEKLMIYRNICNSLITFFLSISFISW